MEFAVDPHYAKKKAEARLQKRLRNDRTRIATAFKTMKTLQEFEIDWDEFCGFHPEFFRAFLAPPLASWQGHLTSLTVKVPPSLVSTLSDVRLSYLETFVFHFTTGGLTEQEAIQAHDGFLVFLNNLKDSLRSLTFTSTHTSRNLNLSHVFDRMGVFPFLRKISLSIPFEGGHLPETSSFVKFLMKHQTTLNHINLFASRCVLRWTPGHPDSVNWIWRILSTIPTPLPHLRGLGVALRPLRSPLSILVEFLRTHPSIETLLLEDRSLETTQISQLFLHPINHPIYGIVHFQTKVDLLTPELIAYFAFKFPNLQTLKVECSQILLIAPGFHCYLSRTRSVSLHSSNFQYIPLMSAPLIRMIYSMIYARTCSAALRTGAWSLSLPTPQLTRSRPGSPLIYPRSESAISCLEFNVLLCVNYLYFAFLVRR
jgi:hypothetical protein